MLISSQLQTRFLLAIAVTGMLCAAPLGAQNTPAGQNGQAGQSSQTGQKNWKDRAEYDLYDAIVKDTNPQSKLDKLNQWKEKYPSTDFVAERRTLFLAAYAALNQVTNALNEAKEILAADPADFTALYYTALLTPQIPVVTKQPPTPEQMADAQKAANALINGALDKQFASDKKPANVTEDQWKKARTDIEAVAHTTLGWVAMQQKQYDQAESEFQKSLSINPANGDVDYWIGTVIAAEKKPEKQSEAFFYFARAASYDGPGSLAPQARAQVMDYVKNAYNKFHGNSDGLDQLLQTAKTNPTPPAGFKIQSVADIAEAKLKQEQEEAAKNPALALWKNIKDQLTGSNGASYFDMSMKGALLPTLSGKVVSMEPAMRPKTVVLAIENGATPDATLKFETPLAGKVEPGTVLSFEGVPESYTASPFMVTFTVDKEHLHGWTGTNPAPARRHTVSKK